MKTEKLKHLVVTLNTDGSKSTNYVFGRITGIIETIIIDNEKNKIFIVGDPDDPKSYILRFWATNEQMNIIRSMFLRIIRKLATFQYYTVTWNNNEEP